MQTQSTAVNSQIQYQHEEYANGVSTGLFLFYCADESLCTF